MKPFNFKSMVMKTTNFSKFAQLLLFCSAIIFIVTACSRNPVTGKKEMSFTSEEKEIALGKSYDPSIQAQFGVYDDAKLQNFITEKGKQMGKISHRPHLDYQFKVVDSPIVNAFAVPGGYIYFTRGIMAHFNNEAEFAGVLGHEIGHVTARHFISQQRNQIFAQVGLIAGVVLSQDIRNNADMFQQSLGLLMLKFGRDDESQSDKLGVEYSTKIGYDSHNMANFFNTLKRLSAKAGQTIPTFLSSHPDPGDRYNKVKQMSNEWQAKVDKNTLKTNRDSYLRMIEGIVYGEDPRQGFVENWNFYHPELKFQFPVPRGWKHQNSPTQFVMGATDQKAMMLLTLGKGNSLEEAAQNAATQYKLNVRESRKTTVNGLPALAMISDQQAQQQQQGQSQQQGQQQQQPTPRILTYFIKYGDLIYAIHGMAMPADFDRYFNTFNNTMTGFKKLNDPDKLNRLPERVRIKTVTQDGTVQSVFQSFGIKQDRMEEIAILNSMHLRDPIKRGTLVKIPGK